MPRLLLAAALLTTSLLPAQQRPVSEQTAATIMAVFPHGRGTAWNYEEGTALDGMDALWYATGNGEYLGYIQRSIDRFVTEDGAIRTYKPADLSLDNILMGRQLLVLFEDTQNKKYATAAALLYRQLQQQPRIPEGGFWHKQRYPSQMWLDGLYMAGPFYAQYAATFLPPAEKSKAFDDIARQFVLLEQHTRDPKTGLLFHAWDQSRKQRWANPATGASPTLWSRAMGWYVMGLVDTLSYIPPVHPAHAQLVALLNRFAQAIVAQQAPDGLWFQVTDKPAAPGNYEESSASAMFVYALARGVRFGWLPATYRLPAAKGYQGILARFVTTGAHGQLALAGTADAVGLGGDPVYRDGSFAYYTTVPTVTNDARGLGALLLASTEMEQPHPATH